MMEFKFLGVRRLKRSNEIMDAKALCNLESNRCFHFPTEVMGGDPGADCLGFLPSAVIYSTARLWQVT
jgi:hypothetical protein